MLTFQETILPHLIENLRFYRPGEQSSPGAFE